MNATLFGQVYNMHDMALKVLQENFSIPYIAARRNFNSPCVMSLSFYQKGEAISLTDLPGLYVIFRRIENHLECLYVGYTDDTIAGRIYRYFKELEGKSRHDESHAGAIIARDKYGVRSTDNHYVKIIPMSLIHKTYAKYGCFIPEDNNHLDEHVAHILGAKCNTEKRNDNNASTCQDVKIPEELM